MDGNVETIITIVRIIVIVIEIAFPDIAAPYRGKHEREGYSCKSMETDEVQYCRACCLCNACIAQVNQTLMQKQQTLAGDFRLVIQRGKYMMGIQRSTGLKSIACS